MLGEKGQTGVSGTPGSSVSQLRSEFICEIYQIVYCIPEIREYLEFKALVEQLDQLEILALAELRDQLE